MGSRLRQFLVGLFALAMFAAAPGAAQVPESRGYSQEELDQLLAPIALYPDQLLMQVLIASTYPLEVIEAARFVQQNPNLRGDALDNALAGKNWDPSVQSLAAYPQVLEMMNEKLDWMQKLGDAFLVDQQRVMDTVQDLRARAAATGALQSTTQQTVVTQDRVIIIEPAQPDYLYVPVYNPYYVYGPWWAPAYEPWFWYPPAIYGYPVWGGVTVGIYFGSAWALSHHHWGWAHPDWHGHRVNIHPGDNRFWNRPGRPSPPPGGHWQHEPGHRRGIAYPDASTYDRFRRTHPDAVRSRQEYRGRDQMQPYPNVMRPTPGTARPDTARPGSGRPGPDAAGPPHGVTRPAPGAAQPPSPGTWQAPGAGHAAPQQGVRSPPRPSAPAFDPGISRQQAQTNALRGQQSRQSSPAPAMPSARPPSAPSAPAPSSAPSAPSSRPSSGAPAPRGGVQKH